jgi:hypothetical protein
LKLTDEEIQKNFPRCVFCKDGCGSIIYDSEKRAYCGSPVAKTIVVLQPPIRMPPKELPPSYRERVVGSRLAFLTKADIEELCRKYSVPNISNMIELCIAYVWKKQPEPEELKNIWLDLQRERRR